MRIISATSLILTLIVSCTSPSKKTSEVPAFETTGSVERLDEQINELIPESARIEILASGFSWSEGPVWIPAINSLVFTDVPENTAYKWNETDSLSVYLKPSGYTGEKTGKEGANGLILDTEGRLILCQHGDRRLARLATPLDAPASSYETIIDRYDSKRFNSPNDVIQAADGTFFFTDPPYGLQEDDAKELDFQGVYRLDTDGSLTLLVDSLTRPNGIALSPDEKTLYVAVSDPDAAKYHAFDLDEDWNVTGGHVLLDVTHLIGQEDRPGLPDGMVVHSSGHLFATGPGGVLVITPEGDLLGTIMTGQPTANCTLDANESTLYMTANMHLMRIKL